MNIHELINEVINEVEEEIIEQEPEPTTSTVLKMVTGHEITKRNRPLVKAQARERNITPTVLGGFKQWMAAGRRVRKGEKALKILVPKNKKTENGEIGSIFFRIASVFDFSQTDELKTESQP